MYKSCVFFILLHIEHTLLDEILLFNSKNPFGYGRILRTNKSEFLKIVEQKDANEDGFIGHISKNHPSNLINICEACHSNIHQKQKKLIIKKTTDGYKLNTISST